MASGVVALTAGDDPSSGRTRTGGSGAASGSGNRADDFAAGAITADYRGGHLVTETCVDSSGATCVPPKFDWEPLVVRCTAEGCTATIFNTTIALDDSPASYQTAFGYEDPACGTAPVTGSLRGVGHVIEHGLERPRRIVGRLRLDATAHRIPTADCLGGVREFAYDATKA
jgi:hypothetical protein